MNRPVDYDDYDEVVVLRIISGERVGSPVGPADAAEAVRRMARNGYHDGQIANRLSIHRRSVVRIRQRQGVAAGLARGGNHYTCAHPEAPSRPRALR